MKLSYPRRKLPMKEQTFYLENFNSFEPKHIFECGQCFRWNSEPDNSYTGVFGNNVLNVKKEEQKIIFKGICEDNIIKTCMSYFNLNTDYKKIKEKLSLLDKDLAKGITYGYGIRILKQDLWECMISFIISANNNIPRIKGIIEKLSTEYGKPIKDSKNTYYTFPTPKELSVATVEDLRKLGLGFRDKRVYETTKIVSEGKINLKDLENETDVNKIKETLLSLPGVGEKVADCIILFALNRFEVFPVDVWVRRVMADLHIENPKERYGNLAGIAQQYLFYWKRGVIVNGS